MEPVFLGNRRAIAAVSDAGMADDEIRQMHRRDHRDVMRGAFGMVMMPGNLDEALGEGFRRLAGFTFGANIAAQKVAMTTPVLGTGDEKGYRVSFVLPRDIIVPWPSDPRIALKNVPARMVAALRFHGRHTVENLEAHKIELARALATRGLKPKGEAMFAGYDPPSTIPLLRRTELWVDIA